MCFHSFFHQDFKNQHLVDQKSTLLDLIQYEGTKCSGKDYVTVLTTSTRWKDDSICLRFLMKDLKKKLRSDLTSFLVNKCWPLVNNVLIFKIFMKNWFETKTYLISTKIENFSGKKWLLTRGRFTNFPKLIFQKFSKKIFQIYLALIFQKFSKILYSQFVPFSLRCWLNHSALRIFIKIQVTWFQRVFKLILRSKVQKISTFQELFIFWHFILTTFISRCTGYHYFCVQGTYVLYDSIYTRRFLVCGVCLFAFLMCVWSVWELENRLRYCFTLL